MARIGNEDWEVAGLIACTIKEKVPYQSNMLLFWLLSGF